MVEYVVKQVGERGGHHLVAEVDEATQTYDVLRQNGFAIYARQRVWKLDELSAHLPSGESPWRPVVELDEIGIRVLYNAVVPGLTQQVEEPPWENLRGLVLPRPDGLLAYIGLTYGPRGVMVNPFFHPDTVEVQDAVGGGFSEYSEPPESSGVCGGPFLPSLAGTSLGSFRSPVRRPASGDGKKADCHCKETGRGPAAGFEGYNG